MAGGNRRRGGRTVSPEERKLWNQVAASTLPLDPPRHALGPDLTPTPEPVRPAPRPDLVAPSSPLTRPAPRARPKVSISTLPPEAGPVGRPEPGLDRRTAERLRKGAMVPEARLDLHGMTVERAHRVCLNFLSGAVARGLRVVLVITGKGRRSDTDIMRDGRGVLRESLPGWLRASPLGHSIVGIYEAHRKHGGAGAFYIYLKRQR